MSSILRGRGDDGGGRRHRPGPGAGRAAGGAHEVDSQSLAGALYSRQFENRDNVEAHRLGPDAVVVTVLPDRMERYFSTELFTAE